MSYLVIFSFNIAYDFAPVARFVGDLPKNAFVFVVGIVVIAKFDNIIFNFGQTLVQINQLFSILTNFLLANLLINGPGYFLNESELEQILKNVEALLKYILLLGLVIWLLLRFEKTVLFFTRLHQDKILLNIQLNKFGFARCMFTSISSLHFESISCFVLQQEQWQIVKVGFFGALGFIIQKIFKHRIRMLKGLYDLDCVTWSPQGKLFQVQYAMQAVKQGSICLGLKSNEYVVLCSLKKLPSELACYQDKMFKVDDYIGMAISGLTADARVLCKYMRNQSLNYKLTYGSGQPINRLIFKIAEKSQVKTQKASKRPYGVGLLVAGIDKDGPHLFETCPSGNYYEYYAYSIGARSQSARTYLQEHLASFKTSTLDELVLHSLAALKKSASDEGEVKPISVEIGIVGRNRPFSLLKEEQIAAYLAKLTDFKGSSEKMDIQS